MPTRLTPDAELLPGGVVTLRGQASWLACRDVCDPGRATLDLALPFLVLAFVPQLAPLLPPWLTPMNVLAALG